MSNKSDSFFSKRLYPLLFMLLVTVVCILATSGLYLGTQTKALANELSFTRKAVLDAAQISYQASQAGIKQAFTTSIIEQDGYYETTGTASKRYVVPLEGPGLWGKISLMVGFEDDMTTFSGVAIVSQNETPGLGARIEEAWFTAQFQGKRAPFSMVEEGTADADNEIDAITGATRTSEYFKTLVDQAPSTAKLIVRGQ